MRNNYRRRYLSTGSNRRYIRFILQLQTVIYINNYNSGCVQKFPFINYKIVLASRDQIHRHEAFIRLLSNQKRVLNPIAHEIEQ